MDSIRDRRRHRALPGVVDAARVCFLNRCLRTCRRSLQTDMPESGIHPTARRVTNRSVCWTDGDFATVMPHPPLPATQVSIDGTARRPVATTTSAVASRLHGSNAVGYWMPPRRTLLDVAPGEKRRGCNGSLYSSPESTGPPGQRTPPIETPSPSRRCSDQRRTRYPALGDRKSTRL